MKKVKQHFKINNKESYNLKDVIFLTIFVSLILTTISSYFIYQYVSCKNQNDIIETYNKILSSYLEDIDQDELSDAAINGMMDYLGEKYSFFLDTDDANSLISKLDGKYTGMGIKIQRNNANEIEILEVYDDTPAKKAGLKKDDIIIKINNKDVTLIDTNELSEILRNNSKVSIEYKRKDKKYKVNVNIKELDTPVVSYEIFNVNNHKVGYIYLSTFSSTAYKQVKSALDKIEKDKIDSLIFDVRSNSGGYLSSVTNILELFIKKGKTLYNIEDKEEMKTYISKTNDYKTYPIVVLIDSLSASASEILATALKESYGAIIVGTISYGKGRVQQTLPLKNNGLIKYTSAKWYTPNKESIDEVGIRPGIYVELTKEYAENPCNETDSQLQKALEVITYDY